MLQSRMKENGHVLYFIFLHKIFLKIRYFYNEKIKLRYIIHDILSCLGNVRAKVLSSRLYPDIVYAV